MISKQELKALAELTLTDSYFVSLYLDVDVRRGGSDRWPVIFRNLVKRGEGGLPGEVRSRIQGDLERIEAFLREKPAEIKRGLAIISCKDRDFWWVYHSMIPFSDELVIDRDPYLKPLMRMIDLFQRYLIVVCESQQVKVFLAAQGVITPMLHLTAPSSRQPLSSPGRGDRGGITVKDQREIAIQWLKRGAVGAVVEVVESENIKRVLLGGGERSRALLREALPQWVKERVVAEFSLPARATPREILQRATPLMQEVERRFEKQAIQELMERVGEGERGSVLGLSDVLTMLQQGNVRKLYVLTQYRDRGMVCRSCGALTPWRDRPCPYCGGEMEEVPYVVDWAIQKAIEQGARVDLLEDSPQLEKAGGIGALLRY